MNLSKTCREKMVGRIEMARLSKIGLLLAVGAMMLMGAKPASADRNQKWCRFDTPGAESSCKLDCEPMYRRDAEDKVTQTAAYYLKPKWTGAGAYKCSDPVEGSGLNCCIKDVVCATAYYHWWKPGKVEDICATTPDSVHDDDPVSTCYTRPLGTVDPPCH